MFSCVEKYVATKSIEKVLYCSFCGKSQHEVKKLISGPSVFICDQCIDLCNDIIFGEERSDKTTPKKFESLTPVAMKEILDQFVVGQDEAKLVLSVAVFNHYLRINNIGKTGDVEIEKANIVLIGPSGSGKTYLAQTVARILSVPFVACDATKFTEAGYVGEDVETMLQKLINSAGGDVPKAERGIIYVDEGDKIARRGDATTSSSRDPSGEGVQHALLRMLEGAMVSVPPKGGNKLPNQDYIQINTKNILFIVGGAFSGLTEVIKKRQTHGSTIGFGASVSSKTDDERDLVIEPEDLIAYGLIPELVGRLPIIAPLRQLSEGDLVRILREPKNALCKQYAELVRLIGPELVFTDSATSAIASLAIKKGTGARGLRTIVENVLQSTFFTLPTQLQTGKKVVKVVVDEDVVSRKTSPKFIHADGSVS